MNIVFMNLFLHLKLPRPLQPRRFREIAAPAKKNNLYSKKCLVCILRFNLAMKAICYF
jgi:hypothetical protein